MNQSLCLFVGPSSFTIKVWDQPVVQKLTFSKHFRVDVHAFEVMESPIFAGLFGALKSAFEYDADSWSSDIGTPRLGRKPPNLGMWENFLHQSTPTGDSTGPGTYISCTGV